MKSNKPKDNKNKSIQEKLAKNHACYVLVTCNAPAADGNMEVEMSYHGDTALASLLLHGAQTYMDEEHETRKSE